MSEYELAHSIRLCNNIAILIHDKPDGDAIASALALYEALGSKRNKILLCRDPIMSLFYSLPNADKFSVINPGDRKDSGRSNGTSDSIDLIFSLDSANLDQVTILDYVVESAAPSAKVVNIDHHRGNTNFGDINIVRPNASSTAEILTTEFKDWGLEVSELTAQLLLVGIVTDTKAFRTFNVTAKTLKTASELVGMGADLYSIVEKYYSGYPISVIRNWSEILKDLKFDQDNGVAVTVIPRKIIEESPGGEQAFKGFPNFIQMSRDVKIVVVLVERAIDTIKVSLRSKPGFDCVNVVEKFGGGGHYAAAGCLLPNNDVGSAEETILNAVYSEMGIPNPFQQ